MHTIAHICTWHTVASTHVPAECGVCMLHILAYESTAAQQPKRFSGPCPTLTCAKMARYAKKTKAAAKTLVGKEKETILGVRITSASTLCVRMSTMACRCFSPRCEEGNILSSAKRRPLCLMTHGTGWRRQPHPDSPRTFAGPG